MGSDRAAGRGPPAGVEIAERVGCSERPSVPPTTPAPSHALAAAALPEWALCQSGQETYELTPLRRGEGSKHGLLDLFENGVEPEQCVRALGS